MPDMEYLSVSVSFWAKIYDEGYIFLFCHTSHLTSISVIYVTAYRTEEVVPMVGLPPHRHFIGFFKVPVQAPTWGKSFYCYSEKLTRFGRLLLYNVLGGTEDLFLSYTPSPHGRRCEEDKSRFLSGTTMCL